LRDGERARANVRGDLRRVNDDRLDRAVRPANRLARDVEPSVLELSLTVAIDARGDIALGYTRSSTARIASRVALAPLDPNGAPIGSRSRVSAR
jgi:hypothetical protein